ncbi:hypothetical protein, partial [uncultured Barnesiella sp.]|uniref:hypothetical protein n=1 Tax=uncultured Barnesiella sp. TaxID=584861 RepID=UPI0026067900
FDYPEPYPVLSEDTRKMSEESKEKRSFSVFDYPEPYPVLSEDTRKMRAKTNETQSSKWNCPDRELVLQPKGYRLSS